MASSLQQRATLQKADHSGTSALDLHRPVVALSSLSSRADGRQGYNAAPYIQDNVTTHNGVQYRVHWKGDGSPNPVIGKRTLPNGAWTEFDLSTVADNPLAAPAASDNHNVLCVAVDSAGFIHVVGNMHDNPLRYVRSANTGDIGFVQPWAYASSASPTSSISLMTVEVGVLEGDS